MSIIVATETANAVRADVEDAGAIDEYAGGKAEVTIMPTTIAPSAEAAVKHTNGDTYHVTEEGTQEGADNEPQADEFTSLRTSIIELVSTSATASAFPESFGFNVSSSGKWILAYSSSALFILSTLHLPNHRGNSRAFRLRRKPLSAAITDAGRLAVLTTPHKIDVYQCGAGVEAPLVGTNQKIETVFLDYEAKTLALAENGEVMAAGSDGCIEIRNLGAGALATDKRQIQCGPLDAIEFSRDGRSILMTAAARRARNTMMISVNGAFETAMFEDESQEEQPLGKMWISQLLFPERLQCRQAVFMPDGTGHMNELLGFDTNNDRFGVFGLATRQFTGKTLSTPQDFQFSRSERFDDCLPAMAADSSHAATAVRLQHNYEIWTYRIPEHWANDDNLGGQSPGSESDAPNRLRPCLRSTLPQRVESSPAETFHCLRWVNPKTTGSRSSRLLGLISTAAMSMPEDVVPTVAPAASGKIVLLDFEAGDDQTQSSLKSVTIDLDDIAATDGLRDEELELEQEVELVRRRTRIQRRQDATNPRESRIRRSLSSSSASGTAFRDVTDFATNRPRRRRSFSSISSTGEDNELPLIAVDEPYSHSEPRTQFQLQRAASVSAHSAAARSHLRALPNRPLDYRRADGLREMPHESDADNWVPPPPPYSERPDNTVSHPVTAFPNSVANMLPRSSTLASPPAQRPSRATIQASATQRVRRSSQRLPRQQASPIGTASVAATQNTLRAPQLTSPNIASPPVRPSPETTPVAAARPTAIPRRPVATQQDPTQLPSAISRPPPGPHALQSPMTFPPAANSHRLSTPTLQMTTSNHAILPRAASTPSSPVSQQHASTASSTTATVDFAPARVLPSPDQLESLQRRPGGGGRPPTPRAAVGARAQGCSRPLSSAELMRDLPPLPPGSHEVSNRASSDGGPRSPVQERRTRRPRLSRLTTIASIASQHSSSADDTATGTVDRTQASGGDCRVVIPSKNTPTGTRRAWWRIGSSSPVTGGQPPGGRASQLSNLRHVGTSRTQLSPAETPPASASRVSPRERKSRCTIM